jgi:GT2 family glycosyltransferase
MDFGTQDSAISHVFGANMVLRRWALDQVGLFDERLCGWGDEEEWQRRYKAAGGSVMYVADAGLWHRKTAKSLKLPALLRVWFKRGIKQIEFRQHQQEPFWMLQDIEGLARGMAHFATSGCCWGLMSASESAGRTWAQLRIRVRWG